MSDFIYSNKQIHPGRLSEEIRRIYDDDDIKIEEFHGEWGTLAVSRNLYHEYQVYETKDYISVVLGGPVLCFDVSSPQHHLDSEKNNQATRAIYSRWFNGKMEWDEDLSGPFIVLFIEKQTSKLTCVTDLMSFIPGYAYEINGDLVLSSHVDALAKAAEIDDVDEISQADFILNGRVTFPYTMYHSIKQIMPASVHTFSPGLVKLEGEAYWLPVEEDKFKSIGEAAKVLQEGLRDYVDAVTNSKERVAQFISGGEDSRTVSGLLPSHLKRDAYIFLEDMNREGKIAHKAASAYGANFLGAIRSPTFYLDVLPAAASLVGSSSQYFNVHTIRFHKSCHLNEYPAVFGGFYSDALLKGRTIKLFGNTGRYPFLPEIKRPGNYQIKAMKNRAFHPAVLEEVTNRRKKHFEYVSRFRKKSADEWFKLWPSSMVMSTPNIHGNRRLFRSYEPFTSKTVVKVSATVPQSWKLNRRLFLRTAKPFLKQTKWLLHGEGRFPYFPWYQNIFIQFFLWFSRQIGKRIGMINGYQGPWLEWKSLMATSEWKTAVQKYESGVYDLEHILVEKQVFESGALDQIQIMNLMQTLYHINDRKMKQLHGKSSSF